jgi:NAD(P)-dependent dehydrogenase (short-subunit alcohol dehydrogenase family)
MSEPVTDLADAHTEQPSLQSRRAVVTGGTTGIGRAIAVLLASEGAKVFICGRNEDHLHDALSRIRELGEGSGMALDLAQPGAAERFCDEAKGWLGGMDIAVINAAIPADDVVETNSEDAAYQIAVDFTSYLTTTREAALRMSEGADIVLIGSMSAVSRGPGASIYIAAKSGIQGFAPSLRKELSERDIKVGLIEPGFTGSDFHYPKFSHEQQRELIEQDKMLRAEDIAVATLFMLRQPRRCAVSHMRVEPRLARP